MMRKKVHLTMQNNNGENGAAVVTTILAYYKKYVSLDAVRSECAVSRMNATFPQLCSVAERFGLHAAVHEKLDAEGAKALPLPAVIRWDKRQYAILLGFGKNKVFIADPGRGNASKSFKEFCLRFDGRAITFTPGENFEPGGKRLRPGANLFRRLQNYKASCALMLLLQILTAVAATVSIAVNSRFVDNILDAGAPDSKGILTAAMLLLLLFRIGVSVVNALKMLKLSEKVAARSASELYKKLLRLPISFFENHGIGDILERLELNGTLDQTFLKTVLPRFIDAAMTVVYMALLFVYSPILAAGCAAFELLYVFASRMIASEIGILSGSINNSQAAASGMALNMLNSIETIKTIGVENQFYSMWSHSARDLSENRFRQERLKFAGAFLNGVLEGLSTAFLLFVSAILIIRGEFTLGIFSSFQAVLSHVRKSLKNATETFEDVENLGAGADRVEDIMARSEDGYVPLTEERHTLCSSISVRDLSFRYNRNDPVVVDGISMDIRPGEFVALVGESGSGKSTLLKLLSGLYRPETGTVLYDGKPRDQIADAVFHASLAVVEQEPVTFYDSVEANLTLWDDCIENYEMILAARDAQIHYRIIASKDGYQTVINENGRNFSGGEIQRLELARALAQEPSILLLDEFTSALDAKTEAEVFKALKDRGAMTCIMAAHRLSTVMSCDRVVVLRNGRIAEMGEPYELCRQDGEFRRLLNDM